MKRFIWTVLATAVSSVSAAYAVRALYRVWCVVMDEPPPGTPTWAGWLVARPLEHQVKHRVNPDNP
jgi:hypothetical protein